LSVDPRRIANWFDQFCDAMTYAHSKGIIHRDLKPANLFVSGDPASELVTVLDFGLAKFHRQNVLDPMFSTEETAVVGTYAYMAPEQRSGNELDARADIYSMGVIGAEALTRFEPPATGASHEWLNRAFERWQRTPVTEGIIRILMTCIAEPRHDRPTNVDELRRSLVPLLRDCPQMVMSKAVTAGGDSETTVAL
jgi:serine/threonine-protein kinase